MSQIYNSALAYGLLKDKFNPLVEEFWIIQLNSILELTTLSLVSRGTLNACLVHPRDVFREAIKNNSFAMIIAHNHPSHELLPSEEDKKLTRRLMKISQLLEIPILDHIIFTDRGYYSFKEKNLI